MIVTGDNRDTEILEVFLNSQIPLVMVGEPDRTDVSYVDTDNYSGGYTATKYLIDLGLQRIGLIATDINKSSEDRLRGYKQALLDHNIAVDEQLIAWGNYTVESGYLAMRALLPFQPDAVFSSNDAMAVGCMRALREANLRVPEDISVVGFDDLPHAMHTEPPLTTIQQTIQESGCEAVELLLKLLNHDGPLPLRTILPNTLIVRGTTRAVQSEKSL
jgi:DNA-binding LacI/PurR family transcriptional regulator